MTGTRSEIQGDDDVLMLLDFPRAHFHAPLPRIVFVTIDGKVYRLLKAMYGLKDAGMKGARCDELDGSVAWSIQHLCGIWESAKFVGQIGCAGATTFP